MTSIVPLIFSGTSVTISIASLLESPSAMVSFIFASNSGFGISPSTFPMNFVSPVPIALAASQKRSSQNAIVYVRFADFIIFIFYFRLVGTSPFLKSYTPRAVFVKTKKTHRRGKNLYKKTPRDSLRSPAGETQNNYWFDVSKAESNAISERGKSKARTRPADSVAPCTLSILPSSHSTESGPL